jgi:uncharacterized membrane protein
VPMPAVYVIDDTAPNAFATGRDPKHASIAITTGLLQKREREELQGVIAHELGHVRNIDNRFALLVAVLVGSIALLADFFLRFTFWGGGRGRSRDGDKGGGGLAAILFIVAIVLAIVAPIVARLVQLAVSRQREYLADATSVELTRNPRGLERALAKIAGDREVLEVANRATQHLYFTNPIKKFEERSSSLFSTHPAIVDRINRLRQLTGEPPLVESDVRALAGLDRRPRPTGLPRRGSGPSGSSGRRSRGRSRPSDRCSPSSRRTTEAPSGPSPSGQRAARPMQTWTRSSTPERSSGRTSCARRGTSSPPRTSAGSSR